MAGHRYPPELRERAGPDGGGASGRVLVAVDGDHFDRRKFGMTCETLRRWVRQAEVDEGRRPGLSTGERERLKALERENRELRRATEILKLASAFFGRELDPRPPTS
jgi:transposase